MKRKAVRILTAGLITASLTGCGAQTKVTSADAPVQEETVVVTQDADVKADAVGDTTADEVVGGNMVFYTEWIDRLPDELGLGYDCEFEPIDEEVTIEDDILIEKGDYIVGYIKGGSTIRLIEHGIDGVVYRVENSSGIGYQYIYVTRDDLLTLNDMKEFVTRRLDGETTTVIDTPEEDMEYIEFTTEKSQMSGVEDYIWECIEDIRYDYSTFCVECTKNDGLIDYRVYYK